MVPRINLVPIILLLVSGCGGPRGPQEAIVTNDDIYHADAEGDEIPRPTLEDGIFPVAEVRVTPEQLPARFASGLPPTIEDFAGSWNPYPPRAYVEKQLCDNDPDMLAKFEQALISANAAGANDTELAASYGELVRWCRADSLCDWARVRAFEPGPVFPVSWVVLENCAGERYETLFSSPIAPDSAVIEYWNGWKWRHYHEPIPYSIRLAEAVATIDSTWKRWEIRSASFTLAYTQNPRAAQVLLDVHDRLPPGELRNAVIPGMVRLGDPLLRNVVDEYCRGPGEHKSICQEDESSPADATSDSNGDHTTGTCIVDSDTQSLISEGNRRASSEVEHCLRELAQNDRAAARRQAEAILALDPPEHRLAGVVRTLTAFATHEDLVSRLLELEILSAGDIRTTDAEEPPLTAEDVLIATRRGIWFDVETDTYPNQHDGLLLRFGAAAGPPLSDCLFEERAPVFELADGTYEVDGVRLDHLPEGRRAGEPYLLNAYLDGWKFEVEAYDLGDWYDVEQCLGLFNAIAIHIEDDTRAISLPTGDQVALVLIAPRFAILTAIAEGLIAHGDAAAAMEAGKAFEDRAFRQLNED